jgi:hypothetical protein
MTENNEKNVFTFPQKHKQFNGRCNISVSNCHQNGKEKIGLNNNANSKKSAKMENINYERKYLKRKTLNNDGNDDSEIEINYFKLYDYDMDLKLVLKDLVLFSLLILTCYIIFHYKQNFFTTSLILSVSFVFLDYLFILFYMNYKVVLSYLVLVISVTFVYCFIL